MTAMPIDRPAVRKDQVWLFQGQEWRVHEILDEGVIVLIGPKQMRDLNGVTADELFEAGRLLREARDPAGVKGWTTKLLEATERAAKPKRPKKPQPPPSMYAWRVSLLALDAAKNTGWSLWIDGALQDYGEVNFEDDVAVARVCERARASLPAVMVIEVPAAVVWGGRSPNTLIGLGAARQAWDRGWRNAGGQKARVVRVYQTRWRGQLFGKGYRKLLGQGERTADMEARYCKTILQAHGHPVPESIGGDAAAALCLGKWAINAGEVGERLPLRYRLVVGR